MTTNIHKIYLSVIVSIFLFFKLWAPSLADTNFQTDINVEYKVSENGTTSVTNTISIKNLRSDYFPKKYSLNLKGFSPQNIKAYESGRLLKTFTEQTSDSTVLTINFENLSIGKGTTKTFIVSYDDSTLTQKTGEIWEVILPKVTDPENYLSYKTQLSIPTSLGEEAYVSPEPTSITRTNDRSIYKFDDYKALQSGVTAGFGIFQVFSFQINYHIESKSGESNEITLPPDTSTQKMYYEDINPFPDDVYSDEDGNWIANYAMNDNEIMDIKVSGFVQIFSKPVNLPGTQMDPNSHDLLPTTYWQSDNPKIQEIAVKLQSAEDIYNYVIDSLNYNELRINDSYERYGALETLNKPNDSLCMEFTDLFIALARAKGIPAREINGYAYSQNSKVEPLSLVSDVLHSWPEYWDDKEKLWIPVDPTWGDTTGGVDFFNKFDLRHFAFVIHSKNPVTPLAPGLYKNSTDPQKDINISFSHLPQRKPLNVKVVSTNRYLIPFFVTKYSIQIVNNGNLALYNFPINVSADSKTQNENISAFLPFSSKEISFVITNGLFGFGSADFISLQAGDLIQNISTNKERVILGQLVVMLSIIFIIVFKFHLRAHRESYLRYFKRIKSIYDHKTKSSKNF